MTEFVQIGSAAGILAIPQALADAAPPLDDRWRDMDLLTLTPEQIAVADDTDVLDLLAAARRRRAQTEALEARALARLDELREGSRYVGDEAALELRVSRHAAAERVAASADLVARMPSVLAAMDDGELDGYTARRLVDVCRGLSDEDAREVDARWAAKRAAGTLNLTDPASLRRSTQRLAVRVNPDAAATRARIARRQRSVQHIPGEDTMSRLICDLPAEVAATAYDRLDRDARRLRNSGDERTLDQLRADILGNLLTGGTRASGGTGGRGAAGSAGSGERAGAMVFLHMPVTTALTMTDTGCELTGYGPIPAPLAREIMTRPDSVLRKVLTDPGTGQVEGLGRTRRRPNQALRDLIAARDMACRFCHRPAAACDVDHLAEWVADGGATDPDNLSAKCEHHHYLKNEPGWDLQIDPDTGEAIITTPAGRAYHRYRESIIDPETHPPPGQPPDKLPF